MPTICRRPTVQSMSVEMNWPMAFPAGNPFHTQWVRPSCVANVRILGAGALFVSLNGPVVYLNRPHASLFRNVRGSPGFY
jgi:hypothetical protein